VGWATIEAVARYHGGSRSGASSRRSPGAAARPRPTWRPPQEFSRSVYYGLRDGEICCPADRRDLLAGRPRGDVTLGSRPGTRSPAGMAPTPSVAEP
jgi:hypothetical protein